MLLLFPGCNKIPGFCFINILCEHAIFIPLTYRQIYMFTNKWLGCFLMRTIANFLRYTGYLNFINGPISHVLLLILVHVQLLSC